MITVIEGPDGAGKTTLANDLAKKTDAYIIHATYNKKWDIKKYHQKLMSLAQQLDKAGINVILDRWAPSEHVYGNVFRDGPKYGTVTLIKGLSRSSKYTWIYCRNENIKQNHLENRERRYEMWDDMEKVQEGYDEYVKSTSFLNWITYDFNKNNRDDFIEDLL